MFLTVLSSSTSHGRLDHSVLAGAGDDDASAITRLIVETGAGGGAPEALAPEALADPGAPAGPRDATLPNLPIRSQSAASARDRGEASGSNAAKSGARPINPHPLKGPRQISKASHPDLSALLICTPPTRRDHIDAGCAGSVVTIPKLQISAATARACGPPNRIVNFAIAPSQSGSRRPLLIQDGLI
jgi:hypothetical protein